MTDFPNWEKKAAALVKEHAEEEEAETRANNEALGLKEGLEGVEGPSIARAKAERAELTKKSEERKKIVEKITSVEAVLEGVVGGEWSGPPTTPSAAESAADSRAQILELVRAEPALDAQGRGVCEVRLDGRETTPDGGGGVYALRVQNCRDSVLRIKSRIIKLLVDHCANCVIEVYNDVVSSSAEVWHTHDTTLNFCGAPVLSVQADQCKNLVLDWAVQEYCGHVVHHGCEGLKFLVGAREREVKEAAGAAGQMLTKLVEDRESESCFFETTGQGYPVFMGKANTTSVPTAPVPTPMTTTPTTSSPTSNPTNDGNPTNVNPVHQAAPDTDPDIVYSQARTAGNEAFKTSDFLQAIAHYTLAVQAKPCPIVLANRAQCWLKLGDMEKCIQDCDRAIALDDGNAKAWFRKGVALHQMAQDLAKESGESGQGGRLELAQKSESYEREALKSLGEAEKLDPKNKQVKDAIGMVSLAHRRRKEKERAA